MDTMSKRQLDNFWKLCGLVSFRRQALELALETDPFVLHLFTITHNVNDSLIPLWGVVHNRNVDRSTLLDIFWQIWPELEGGDEESIDPMWDWHSLSGVIEKRCLEFKKHTCRYAIRPAIKDIMLNSVQSVKSYMLMGDEGIAVDDEYIEIPDSYRKGGAYPIPGGDGFKYWYEDRLSAVLIPCGSEKRFRLSPNVESVQFDTVSDELCSLSLWPGDELELKNVRVCVLHNSLDGAVYQNEFRWNDVEMLQVYRDGKALVFDTPWKDTVRMIGMEV